MVARRQKKKTTSICSTFKKVYHRFHSMVICLEGSRHSIQHMKEKNGHNLFQAAQNEKVLGSQSHIVGRYRAGMARRQTPKRQARKLWQNQNSERKTQVRFQQEGATEKGTAEKNRKYKR
jgi:hypothetical protein